jgi:hypothetical protein
MKKSILFFLLIGMTFFISCETQETVLTEPNKTTSIYNTAIIDYFNNYKASLNNNKEFTKKISALMQAVDYSSIKQYDLKTTEKLLVVDLKEFNFNPNATNNKLILFVNDNKIARARLVNFESQDTFNQYDALIVSILNMDKTKLNYTGRVNQFSVTQIKEFSNVFADGKLIENGAAKNKVLNTTITRGDCIDWYWVTTYSNGSQSEEYLYTTCGTCDFFDRSACAGGGSGGSGGGGDIINPAFPDNPIDGAEKSETDADGNFTKYRYSAKDKKWIEIKNILSDVSVRRQSQKYSVFIVIWPRQGQKVVFNGLIYTYDASGTGNWEGEPATDEKIDASGLTGKAKCLNDLLTNSGDLFLQKLLANFQGTSEFNINIVSKDNVFSSGKEVNGATFPPFNNTILIEISTSRSNNQTALDAARTILHEYIHADIWRKLSTTNNVAAADFKKLYDLYDSQHGAMAALYLNSMKEALKDFHKNALTEDYNKYVAFWGHEPTDAFYEAMAWGGLQENDVKDWVDLPAEKKKEIIALANKENAYLTKNAPCP